MGPQEFNPLFFCTVFCPQISTDYHRLGPPEGGLFLSTNRQLTARL